MGKISMMWGCSPVFVTFQTCAPAGTGFSNPTKAYSWSETSTSAVIETAAGDALLDAVTVSAVPGNCGSPPLKTYHPPSVRFATAWVDSPFRANGPPANVVW